MVFSILRSGLGAVPWQIRLIISIIVWFVRVWQPKKWLSWWLIRRSQKSAVEVSSSQKSHMQCLVELSNFFSIQHLTVSPVWELCYYELLNDIQHQMMAFEQCDSLHLIVQFQLSFRPTSEWNTECSVRIWHCDAMSMAFSNSWCLRFERCVITRCLAKPNMNRAFSCLTQ